MCFAITTCVENNTTSIEEPIKFVFPEVMIDKMMRGINIGNTLEPPTVGEWNNAFIEEYFFDDYKDAGFNTVRVPIRWDKHTMIDSPFVISSSWLDTIETVIDWGLERDLYIIINSHHDWWLVEGIANLDTVQRFTRIWAQISDRFKDKSEKLLFEIINEPHGISQNNINYLNEKILDTIRIKNPKRIVIYSGNEWSNSTHLISAKILNDDYIMGYFHAYDPWDFAGKGNGAWGSDYDIERIKSKFNEVGEWSKNNNVPVMVSEFGAIRDCDYNSRMLHYFIYVKEALRNDIAFQAWDDGGQFRIYNRESRNWPEVKDILISTYFDSPSKLNVTYISDNQALLKWLNESMDCSNLIVEKKISSEPFKRIAILDSASTEYIDNSPSINTSIYRIIADCGNNILKYSNPAKPGR